MRLVVLDRDGVINADSPEFIKSPDEWQPLPGSLEAIAELTNAGYTVAVASNQSGLARGLFTIDTLNAIHARMNARVSAVGGRIDAIAFCPHGPGDGCRCRKPAPGLLADLARRFSMAPSELTLVGDSLRDLQAAAQIGAGRILVRTGNGAATAAALPPELADTLIVDDLAHAATHLLA